MKTTLQTSKVPHPRGILGLPLRVKLLLLILSCLAVALASQIVVTTQFMLRDKSAYLYDYLMAQVRVVSSSASASPGAWKKETLRISDYSQVQFLFVDSLGKAVFAEPTTASTLLDGETGREFLGKLNQQSFRTGVRSLQLGGEGYLVAYDRIQGWEGHALGFLKQDLVAAAGRSLMLYSIGLGATLFFLAGGAAVFLARHLTRRIDLLVTATESVGDGHFEVQLDPKRFGRDEIGSLARSFEAMARKIRELISRTAETARMETELKTARLVQERLVPRQELVTHDLALAAFYSPASECSGDWWTAQSWGDDAFFMVGDVTGHGAAAALITAAAFGAIEALDADGATGSDLLDRAAHALNKAILKAGVGEASMSAILGIYSTTAKKLWLINASHRPPLLIAGSGAELSVKPLILNKSAALGVETNPAFEIITQSMPARSTLALYTDGLVETPGMGGRALGSKGFVNLMQETLSSSGTSSLTTARDQLVTKFGALLGANMETPGDDLTLLLVGFSEEIA